jgi:hypothetical protein
VCVRNPPPLSLAPSLSSLPNLSPVCLHLSPVSVSPLFSHPSRHLLSACRFDNTIAPLARMDREMSPLISCCDFASKPSSKSGTLTPHPSIRNPRP